MMSLLSSYFVPTMCQMLSIFNVYYFFYFHTTPWVGFIIFPFCRCGDWGPDKLSNLPKIKQLLGCRARIWIEAVGSLDYEKHPVHILAHTKWPIYVYFLSSYQLLLFCWILSAKTHLILFLIITSKLLTLWALGPTTMVEHRSFFL